MASSLEMLQNLRAASVSPVPAYNQPSSALDVLGALKVCDVPSLTTPAMPSVTTAQPMTPTATASTVSPAPSVTSAPSMDWRPSYQRPQTATSAASGNSLDMRPSYQKPITPSPATQPNADGFNLPAAVGSAMERFGTDFSNLRTASGIRGAMAWDQNPQNSGTSNVAVGSKWTAYWNAMTPEEQRTANSISSTDQTGRKLGEYVNSLNLEQRAQDTDAEQRRNRAAELEAGISAAKPSFSPTGTYIAEQVLKKQYSTDWRRSQADFEKQVNSQAVYGAANFLTDQQKETIRQYADAGDFKAVEDYYKSLSRDLEAKAQTALDEAQKKKSGSSGLSAAAAGAGSAVLNIAAGIPAYGSMLWQGLKNEVTGKYTPVDYNSPAFSLVHASRAMQEGGQEYINETFQNNPAAREAASLIYGGVSSGITNAGQFLLGSKLLGLSGASLENFVLGGMTVNAAGQSAYEAGRQGQDPGTALVNGAMTGLIEYFTEKGPIHLLRENVSTFSRNGIGNVKDVMKRLARQAGSEAWEEVVGNTLGQTWDVLFNGKNSAYSTAVQEIVSAKEQQTGRTATEEDVKSAREQAFLDLFVIKAAESAVSAAISVAFMDGIPSAANNLSLASAGRDLRKADGNAAVTKQIEKGLIFPEDSTAHKLAVKAQTATEEGRRISNIELGRLALNNAIETANIAEIIEAAGDPRETATLFPVYFSLGNTTNVNNKVSADTLRAWMTYQSVQDAMAAAATDSFISAETPDPARQSAAERYMQVIPNMKPQTAERRASIIQRLIDGEAVGTADLNRLDLTNRLSRQVFSDVTGVQFPAGRLTTAQLFDIARSATESAAEPAVQTAQTEPRENSTQAAQDARAEAVDRTIAPNEETPQSNVPARPAQSAEERNSGVTYTSGNRAVRFRWAVVPAESLVVSNDETGAANPEYPAEMQPRDRARSASQLQISAMSRNLNPALLADNPTAQNGAPIVRSDGVVIGGNARSAAIRLAYRNGNADNYAQYIRDNAERYGIDRASIPEHPVLVRVAEDSTDFPALARDLNAATTASYSPSETAQSDAARLTPEILSLIVPNDSGNLNSRDNLPFIQAFVASVPESERAAMQTRDGRLSRYGLMRAENAIFDYTYSNQELLENLSESLDADARNVTNALLQAAPSIASLQVDMQNGDAYNVPMVSALMEGLTLYSEARDAGITVQEILDQASMEAHSIEAAHFASLFEQQKRSARAIRDFLKDTVEAVREQGGPNQVNLLGEDTDNGDLQQAIDTAERRYDERERRPFQRPDTEGLERYAGLGGESGAGRESASVPADAGNGEGGAEAGGAGGGGRVRGEGDGGGRAASLMEADGGATLTERAEPESDMPEGTGAASYGFDPISNAANLYGAIEPGETPHGREIDVPVSMTGKDRNSKAARSVLEAPVTPEGRLDAGFQAIADLRLSHIAYSDDAAKSHAERTLQENGWDRTLIEWRRDVRDGKVSKDIVAIGATLLNNAGNNPECTDQEWVDILEDYASAATLAGQGVQAQRILKQLSPEWQAYRMQRAVEQLNQEERDRMRRRSRGAVDGAVDAVNGARNEAADEVQRQIDDLSRRLRIETQARGDAENVIREIHAIFSVRNQRNHGIPVGNWMLQVGENVADNIIQRLSGDNATTESSVTRTIQQDLLRFVDSYLPHVEHENAATRTAAMRIQDFFQNRAHYERAWQEIQDRLRDQYRGDPTMLNAVNDFLNSDAGPGENVLNRAILDALLYYDASGRQRVIRQLALGDRSAVEERIMSSLTGSITNLTEADETELWRAVRRYTQTIIEETASSRNGVGNIRLIQNEIRREMRELGVKMSDIIKRGAESREALAKRISDMLITEYSISEPSAQDAAQKVLFNFQNMVEKASSRRLEGAFKNRPPMTVKLLRQRFDEFANEGAWFSDRFNELATEKFFGPRIALDKALLREYVQAKDDKARNAAIDKMVKDVAGRLHATPMQKLTALRYTAMLGNFRTIGRNLVGNFGYQVFLELPKEAIRAGMERVAARAGIIQEVERSFTYRKADYDTAKTLYEDYKRLILTGGKAESGRMTFSGRVNEEMRIFGDGNSLFSKTVGEVMEQWRKKTNNALDEGDAFFCKHTFAVTVAQYLKAHDITWETATLEQKDAAAALGVREAAQATFRDNSMLAEAISGMGWRNPGNNRFKKLGNLLLASRLPFKKTPANILVRGFEYTPLGYLATAVEAYDKAHGSDTTTTQLINELAKNTTGTMLFAIGLMAAKAGILRGFGRGDEKEREFAEMQGYQKYSLTWHGVNYTIDWLAPTAIPLFLGANMYESLCEDRPLLDAFYAVVTGVTDPILELTCLSSINSMFDEVSKSYGTEGNAFGKLLVNSLWSLVMQPIPALLGQTERAFQGNYRTTTHTDSESAIPSDLQYQIARLFNRIPGKDMYQIPYIDAWGRTQANFETDWGGRIDAVLNGVNQYVGTGYERQIHTSPMEAELERLYTATMDKDVLPQRPDKTINIGGSRVRMTGAEFVEFASVRGQKAYDTLTELVASQRYKKMSDTDKASAVEDAFSAANDYAKKQVFTDAMHQKYDKYGDKIKKELMSLDGYSGFAPTGDAQATYKHPDEAGKILRLDERAKEKYRQMYDAAYRKIIGETMQGEEYKAASKQNRAEMLSAARDTVIPSFKPDFLVWMVDSGYKAEEKQ